MSEEKIGSVIINLHDLKEYNCTHWYMLNKDNEDEKSSSDEKQKDIVGSLLICITVEENKNKKKSSSGKKIKDGEIMDEECDDNFQ